MSEGWDKTKIEAYIVGEIQESLTLDYKAADALGRNDQKKNEITKDISAMANSAGGIIIYGVKEYQQPDRKHLPEKIDPIDQTYFSKEWLEQIINNIRPRIDGIMIYPVPIDKATSQTVYVVEIPQSTTAHQATDKRYYKRYNFLSVPMEDYEIRDVMGRNQHPSIDLAFKIQATTKYERDMVTGRSTTHTECTLIVTVSNIGSVYAQYVNGLIEIPSQLLQESIIKMAKLRGETLGETSTYHEDNTVRDVIDTEFGMAGPIDKYGPSRFDPILPGLKHRWKISLNGDLLNMELDELVIKWSAYADNAPPKKGEIALKNIEIVDLRK